MDQSEGRSIWRDGIWMLMTAAGVLLLICAALSV
jgi:hypothetical protein